PVCRVGETDGAGETSAPFLQEVQQVRRLHLPRTGELAVGGVEADLAFGVQDGQGGDAAGDGVVEVGVDVGVLVALTAFGADADGDQVVLPGQELRDVGVAGPVLEGGAVRAPP